MKKNIDGYVAWTCLFVGLAAISCSLWLYFDTNSLRGDSTYYLHGGLALMEECRNQGWNALSAVLDLADIRPPLQSLIGALIFWVSGREIHHAVYINILWLILTSWMVYGVGLRLSDRRIAALSVALFVTNPLWLSLLWQFETETPLAFCVAATFLVLFRILERGRRRDFVFWGMLVSAGLLLKWTYALMIVGPTLATVFTLLRRGTLEENAPLRRGWESWWLPIGIAVTIPVIVALPWYDGKAGDLIEYQQRIAQTLRFTLIKEGWSWQTLWVYPQFQLIRGRFIHTFLFLVGLGWCLTQGLRRAERGFRLRLLCIFSALLLPWLYYVINYTNTAEKYLAPVQALLAVIGALTLYWFPLRRRTPMFIALVSLLFLLFFNLQWGLLEYGIPKSLNHAFDRWRLESGWRREWFDVFSYPPQKPSSVFVDKTVAETIARRSEQEGTVPRVMVLCNTKKFDGFLFSPYLRARFPSASASVAGGGPWLPNLVLFYDYLISENGESLRADTENLSYEEDNILRFTRFLDNPPTWFLQTHRYLGTFSRPGGDLHLFQRTQPITPFEIAEWMGMIVHKVEESEIPWNQIRYVWGTLRNETFEKRAALLQSWFRLKDPAAFAALLQSYSQNPGEWRPYEKYALALSAGRAKRPDLARELMREIVPLGATCSWAAALKLGQWALAENRLDEAARWLNTAWDLNWLGEPILENLADTSRRLGQTAQADGYQDLRPIIQKLYFYGHLPYWHLQAAECLRKAGLLERAAAFAARAYHTSYDPNLEQVYAQIYEQQRAVPFDPAAINRIPLSESRSFWAYSVHHPTPPFPLDRGKTFRGWTLMKGGYGLEMSYTLSGDQPETVTLELAGKSYDRLPLSPTGDKPQTVRLQVVVDVPASEISLVPDASWSKVMVHSLWVEWMKDRKSVAPAKNRSDSLKGKEIAEPAVASAAPRVESIVKFWEFDKENDWEGWYPQKGIQNLSISAGSLAADTMEFQPTLVLSGLNLPADRLYRFRMRIRTVPFNLPQSYLFLTTKQNRRIGPIMIPNNYPWWMMKTREAALTGLFAPGEILKTIELIPTQFNDRIRIDRIELTESAESDRLGEDRSLPAPLLFRWDVSPHGNLTAFRPNDQMMKPEFTQGRLVSVSTQNDPILLASGLELPTDSLLNFRVKMMNSTDAAAQVFFYTKNNRWVGPLDLPSPAASQEMAVRKVPLNGFFLPSEKIAAIRFDPTFRPNDRFGIEWIELIGFPH